MGLGKRHRPRQNRLNLRHSAIYSTCMGGDTREVFEDAESTPGTGLVVSGTTTSKDFPTVMPISSTSPGGMYDIIVADSPSP